MTALNITLATSGLMLEILRFALQRVLHSRHQRGEITPALYKYSLTLEITPYTNHLQKQWGRITPAPTIFYVRCGCHRLFDVLCTVRIVYVVDIPAPTCDILYSIIPQKQTSILCERNVLISHGLTPQYHRRCGA